MSLNDLLSKVRQTSEKRSADLSAEWWRAVRSAGAGKAVDAEKVAALLERTGRTADDFADAARGHARRLELHATVAAEPEAVKARAAAVAGMIKLDAEFEKQEAAYLDARRPLEHEVAAADQASQDATAARSELFHGCPYDGVKARFAEATASVIAADARVRDLIERRQRVVSFADLDPTAERNRSHSVNIANFRERLPKLDAEIEAARRELTAAKAVQAEAEAEMRRP